MKQLILFGLLLVYSALTFSQNPNPLNQRNAVPTTPEVAALGKFIDIPVGHGTGTAEIGVPVFTLSSGSLQVPIGLSYNTSGIKVEESSTWVGLGWNLNVGGNISRVVKGLHDDIGLMTSAANKKVMYLSGIYGTVEYNNAIHGEVVDGSLDVEPDIFIFQLLNYSGKFYWSQDSTKFVLSPYQNIKIDYTGNQFVLTLPNGIKGFFGVSEDGLRNSREFMNDQQTTFFANGMSSYPAHFNPNAHVSGWSLMDIIHPSGKRINYYYTSVEAKNFGRGGETTDFKGQFNCGAADNDNKSSFYQQLVYKPVLQKISAEQFDVYFVTSPSVREDVFMNEKALDSIVIKSKTGKYYKSFYLDKGYFTSSTYSSLPGLDAFAQIARKRLYLKSVKEISSGKVMPPYEFTYSSVQLPDRLSAAQDYWGYYNGKNSHTQFLTPKLRAKHFFGSGDVFYNSWAADRRIDTAYHQAGSIIQVKYPTGGTTDYTYETNQASLAWYKLESGLERSELISKQFHQPKPSFSYPVMPGDPEPLVFTDTVTVADIQGTARISTQYGGTCPYGYTDASCRFTTTIRSLSDPNFSTITIMMTVESWYQLPQGQYEIKTTVTETGDPVPSWSLDIHWEEQPNKFNFWVGGLRVKKIVSRPIHGNPISKSFLYNDFDTAGKSSGFVLFLPFHVKMTRCIWQELSQWEADMGWPPRTYDSYSYRATSYPQLPLSGDGQHVRYLNVSEFYDTLQQSFKTEYTFSNDVIYNNPPPPLHSVERTWHNNRLLKKTVFEKYSNGFRPLREETNFYQAHRVVVAHPFGIHYESYPTKFINLIAPKGISWTYHYASDWYLLDSTHVKSYSYPSSGTNIYQEYVKFYYNDFMLPSLQKMRNSRGEMIENRTWYPNDFDNNTAFNISNLVQNRIWDLPVKTAMSIDGKMVSGKGYRYSTEGLPLEFFAYENSQDVSVPAHSRTVILEPTYKSKLTLAYNSQKELLEKRSITESLVSYIWDYMPTGQNSSISLPTAVVSNALSTDIGYTSFEMGTFGNWVTTTVPNESASSITGKKVLVLSGSNSLSISGLSSNRTYILSYWATNQLTVNNSANVLTGTNINGLTRYEHKIVNPSNGLIQITGNGTLDEVKLHPLGSSITSFVYNDLAQIIAQGDTKGDIVYYEYDVFNRLSVTKDLDKNIMKKYCYNYAGQPEDCGLGTAPQWQVVDIFCQQTNGINTGNEMVVEKDTNPNSATYGNTNTTTISNSANCYVCTTSNCSGEGKKCLNNICEAGVKVYTGTLRINQSTMRCYYHYQWSDNSTSQTYYEDKPLFTPCY